MAKAFTLTSPLVVRRGALLSECGRYRYRLWREWGDPQRRVCFIGCNPSVADAQIDDQTIVKEVGFATRWGFGALDKVNLYPLIATDPQILVRALRANQDVFGGLRGIRAPIEAARQAGLVVCAWGDCGGSVARATAADLVAALGKLGIRLYCLGRTKSGAPRHPVRLAYDTPLEVFGG